MPTEFSSNAPTPVSAVSASVPIRPLAAITGASSGLGRDFALQLAAKGFDLLLVARRVPLLEALKAEIQTQHGVAVEIFPADLADPEQLKGLETRLAQIENLEVLVNNAGFGFESSTPFEDIERECQMIKVHVFAPVRLAHAALRPMLRRGRGFIVNVSSVAAFLHGSNCAQYAATKAYLLSFSKCLHEDVRRRGVRVQALCPGFTRTDFFHTPLMDVAKYRRFPGFAWLESGRVVRDSLRALFRRRGGAVCIPSWRYRIFAALMSSPPFSWLSLKNDPIQKTK